MIVQPSLLRILTYLALVISIYGEIDIYRPQYHLTPPIGHWMNDPNGPFYDEVSGMYHLFYQYNPSGYNWGNMSWAHVVSPDMLTWTELPVALLPDQDYDKNGVFSGSVFVEEGVPIIYYTCVNGQDEQLQCQANPLDDKLYINWTKDERNPIISGPPVGGNKEFRDPFVFVDATTEESKVIAIVAAQQYEYGTVAKYERKGGDWEYIGSLWSTLQSPNTDAASENMVECPDFFPLQGNIYSGTSNSDGGEEDLYVLKYSLMNTRRDYYEMGSYHDGAFIPDGRVGIVDNGPKFSYYASKTFYDSSNDGRRILWGWSPETDHNTGDRHWQGVMALPRIVEYVNDWKMLRFSPVPALDALRKEVLYEGEEIMTWASRYEDVLRSNAVNITPLGEGVSSMQSDVSVSFDVTAIMASSNTPVSTEVDRGIEMGVSIAGCGNASYTLIGFRLMTTSGQIYTVVDTTHSGGSTPSSIETTELPYLSLLAKDKEKLYEDLSLRVLVDHSMIEVFFVQGISVSTVRVYADSGCQDIALYNRNNEQTTPQVHVNVHVYAMSSEK